MTVKRRTQSALVVVLLMLASWSRDSVSLTLAADSVPASSSTDTRLSLDEWTYIRVDDSRGKWGDTDEPKWLRYFGLATCDLTGDGMKDIVSGRYFYRNPGGNMTGSWQRVDLGRNVHAILALDVADVDADGSLDIVAGNGEKYVAWWRNPATGEANWQRYIIGTTAPHPADRLKARDMNGDGKIDVVVTEERYPGKEPDANLWWFEQPADPKSESWTPHRIVTEYSLNNLDLADFDRDGDFDVVTCEHKGPDLKLQIFENDGCGHFTEHIIDRGKESHLGTQATDLDEDGDVDLVSIAWDRWQDLHLWRNDAHVGQQSGHQE